MDEQGLIENPFKLHEYLLNVIKVSKSSFVLMGKALYYLKQEDRFKKAVGMGADDWKDYLKQPEIGLSTQEASRLMRIYEEFILRLGYDEDTISEVPIKNMFYLLPLVKKIDGKEEVDELLADATLLSQRDFRERVYDVRVEESNGELGRTYEYIIMRKTIETGLMERVMEIESDFIKRAFPQLV